MNLSFDLKATQPNLSGKRHGEIIKYYCHEYENSPYCI